MAQSLVSSSGRAMVKSGVGKLTASSCGNSTHLTRVSHAAPTRLIPMRSSAVQRAGAALVAVSSYGGGMLQGDSSMLNISVEEGATLGLVTQGSNRIYKSTPSSSQNSAATTATEDSILYPTGDEQSTCRSDVVARVATDGFLVMAPDPCVTFSSSSFVQNQHVHLEPGASAILVDWFGAGRIFNGERWDFRRLVSRTSLYNQVDESSNENDVPFLVESVMLDQRYRSPSRDPFGFNAGALEFNAFCSVINHGPAAQEVVARCKSLEQSLVAKHTRVRKSTDDNGQLEEPSELNLLSMSGRVLMGVSKVDNSSDDIGPTYVTRLAATSNEDIYRVLHSCLQPLHGAFGIQFYRDRIQASATAEPSTIRREPKERSLNGANQQLNGKGRVEESTFGESSLSLSDDSHATWCAYMLADSGLPTGGFAHSAGIEAASQLGLFGRQHQGDEELVSDYILAATRSATQLWTPFVRAGHELASRPNFETAIETWLQLDQLAHASVASNAPACRASLDQGEGLLRVAIKWLQSSRRINGDQVVMLERLQQRISDSSQQRGHVGPIFGLVCGLLGLSAQDACRVFGFCAARDMVSAAVRLNLVGPLASVSILDSAGDAVNGGIEVALAAASATITASTSDQNVVVDPLLAGVVNAAACSPVADAIHPSQDLLSVRLFRT